jgi:hypothetical protein
MPEPPPHTLDEGNRHSYDSSTRSKEALLFIVESIEAIANSFWNELQQQE